MCQQRLPKLVGIVSSQLSTSAQEMLKAENHGAVAFFDIPPGSRRIRARRQLNQVVPVGDSPILCLPAPGNKSSVFQPYRNGEIRAASIGATLAARYDFSKHFEYFRSILCSGNLSRIRDAGKSPRRERFTSSAGIKCQKLFGQDRTWKRKESCCGRSFASDRISAKNAWPRARHRSRQFRSAAARSRLLPDRQIPASRRISRSDSRL
jgi:hypothetical protein